MCSAYSQNNRETFVTRKRGWCGQTQVQEGNEVRRSRLHGPCKTPGGGWTESHDPMEGLVKPWRWRKRRWTRVSPSVNNSYLRPKEFIASFFHPILEELSALSLQTSTSGTGWDQSCCPGEGRLGDTLSTKVHIVKAVVFPVVMYGCESWTIKKIECRIIDAF